MEKLELFLKKNKIKKENIFFPATASLLDENGEPLLWELRAIKSAENNKLVEEAMTRRYDAETDGFEEYLDNRAYMKSFIAAAVVYPDLYNKALQDSYGVMTPGDLLEEMIDSPAEFNALAKVVKEHSGLGGKAAAKEVETAKN